MANNREIEKMPTGISGLDEILQEGIFPVIRI